MFPRQCVIDHFRNSSFPDLTGDLNWEKITALTEAFSDSVAIAIKGKQNINDDGNCKQLLFKFRYININHI